MKEQKIENNHGLIAQTIKELNITLNITVSNFKKNLSDSDIVDVNDRMIQLNSKKLFFVVVLSLNVLAIVLISLNNEGHTLLADGVQILVEAFIIILMGMIIFKRGKKWQ